MNKKLFTLFLLLIGPVYAWDLNPPMPHPQAEVNTHNPDPVQTNKALFKAKNAQDVQDALKKGADINFHAQGPLGETPLIDSIMKGKMDVFTALLNLGADPNAANNEGVTPLMIAVKMNNEDMVKALLAKKADKTKKDKSGYTAMRYAQENKLTSMVQLLK